MATIYAFKPAFQSLLGPMVGRLARAGVTANQVTVGAALLSVAYGAALFAVGAAPAMLVGLPAVLFIRMALNAIDGMLAREHGQKSDLGRAPERSSATSSRTPRSTFRFAAIPGVLHAPRRRRGPGVLAGASSSSASPPSPIGASRRY